MSRIYIPIEFETDELLKEGKKAMKQAILKNGDTEIKHTDCSTSIKSPQINLVCDILSQKFLSKDDLSKHQQYQHVECI